MSKTRDRSKAGKAARSQTTRTASPVPDELTDEQAAEILQIRDFFRDGGAYGIDERTGEIYAGREFAELLTVLLRYVQRLDGAPGRRRDARCRKGICHLALDENDTAICRGGIRPGSIHATALIIGGLIEVGKHYCPNWFAEAA